MNDQKIVAETFYQNFNEECQYLQCYTRLSYLSFEFKFNPTFSMKFISEITLEKVFQNPSLIQKWTTNDMMNCLFSVAEGLSYLHSHLICHGNLCPSNILIDELKQCYLIDFGLYPIKQLYYGPNEMTLNDYKDPYLKNSEPTFISDIYSYGVLMLQFCILFFMDQQKEPLEKIISRNDPNKYNCFPKIFSELIPICLETSIEKRPSINQIISKFKDPKYQIKSYNVNILYNNFIQSNYIANLANKNNSFALNKLGKMYEKGKNFPKDYYKALFYYEKAALLNNSEAQNNYGMLLQKYANQSKQQIEKGAYYLELSAKQGNIHGMTNYGISLLQGDINEINIEMAEEFLKNAAGFEYSEAQAYYGLILVKYKSTQQRICQGLKCIKKALNQNNPAAYYFYGNLLQEGIIVDKNIRLANLYFTNSVEMGNNFSRTKMIFELLNKQVRNTTLDQTDKQQISQNSNSTQEKGQIADDLPLVPEETTKQKSPTKIISINCKTENAVPILLSTEKPPNKDSIDSSNPEIHDNELSSLQDDAETESSIPSITEETSQSNLLLLTNEDHSDLNTDNSSDKLTPKKHPRRPIRYKKRRRSNKVTINISKNTPPDKLMSQFKQYRHDYYAYRVLETDDKLKYQLFKKEEKFIQTNNADIIYKYGKFYSYEDSFQSKEKSLQYFQKAADLGHIKAQTKYGDVLCSKKNNKNLGIEYLKKAADKGYTPAELKLGIYLNDPVAAHKYIEKAFLKHYQESYYYYAMDFFNGRGVEQNYNKASEILFELYKDDKTNKILYPLVQCLKVINYNLAVEYIKVFINSKDKDFDNQIHEEQFQYGIELFYGDQIERNENEAIQYLLKSNRMNKIKDEYPDVYACMPHDFSIVKEEVDAFLKRNGEINQQEKQIIQNAYNGVVDDIFHSAQMIEKAGDFNTAIFFYELAADSNQIEAAYVLGNYYKEGKNGLNVDLPKSKKYLNKVLKHGGYQDSAINGSRLPLNSHTSQKDMILHSKFHKGLSFSSENIDLKLPTNELIKLRDDFL